MRVRLSPLPPSPLPPSFLPPCTTDCLHAQREMTCITMYYQTLLKEGTAVNVDVCRWVEKA